jgi:predicted LPLAT superfamily acyltransferase
MDQENKSQEKVQQEQSSSDTPVKNLKWENKVKGKGIILELLQPIIGNFVLLIEEERKRTLEKMEQAKDTLERMKENR